MADIVHLATCQAETTIQLSDYFKLTVRCGLEAHEPDGVTPHVAKQKVIQPDGTTALALFYWEAL